MVCFTKPFWLTAILTSLSTVAVGSLRPRRDPDILYYKGKKLLLMRYELDPLLMEKFGLDENELLATSSHYEYVATWEIANDMLYLRSISAHTAWVEMANLFPGYEQGQCVPATWVSDSYLVETPTVDEGATFFFWIQDGKLAESKDLIVSAANNEPPVEPTEDDRPAPYVASSIRIVPPPPTRLQPNEDLQYRDDHPSWCALIGKDSAYDTEKNSLANEEASQSR